MTFISLKQVKDSNFLNILFFIDSEFSKMVVREGKETLAGKRPRSPNDHKSMCEKENNKRHDKDKPRIHSRIRSLLKANDRHDMASSAISDSEFDFDMRTSSPPKHDVPGSPTSSAPRLPSKLKHVLLYENMMEQRLLDLQIRRIDSQQHRGAIAMATDIARVRESSARLKQSARTSRVNTADAVGAVRSSLPPIITDLNHHFAPYGEPPTVQSPTEVIRQRALRQKARSAGTFLPKISKEESKPEPKSKTKRFNSSLPHLIDSKYGLSTWSTQNIQNDAPVLRPKTMSHSAITRRSVDDERFKQLQDRLLDMSSVLDLEKRLRPWVLKNARNKTTTVETYIVGEEKVNEEDNDDEIVVDDFQDENDENVFDANYYDRKHPNTPVNNFKCNDMMINEL